LNLTVVNWDDDQKSFFFAKTIFSFFLFNIFAQGLVFLLLSSYFWPCRRSLKYKMEFATFCKQGRTGLFQSLTFNN